MRIDLLIHILAGGLGIATGFIALYSAKGNRLHRKSGMLFVYTMLVMSLLGAGIAALRNVAPLANVPAGLLTTYLVITGLATVRPPSWWSRKWNIALMLVALLIGLADLSLGIHTFIYADPKHHWMLVPFSIFGSIGLLAAAGDVRMIRLGAPSGTARIARHLWRMSFALFIATMSFFLGQAKVFPQLVRTPALLSLPVLAVLVTMLYWMWRVRSRRMYQRLATTFT